MPPLWSRSVDLNWDLGYSARYRSSSDSRILRAKMRNSGKRRPSGSPLHACKDDFCSPCPLLSSRARSCAESTTCSPKTCTNASLMASACSMGSRPWLLLSAKRSKFRRSSATSSREKPSLWRYTARNATSSSKESWPFMSASTTLNASTIIARCGTKPSAEVTCRSSSSEISPLLSVSYLSKTRLNCARSYTTYFSINVRNSSKSR
mmetsp:Transcript_120002/g.334770  ORF Transcript_120002/g.334770 Transcript_120002/m.334770 type:complete len:207 (+) Transcript_120002:1435-2055(+)